MNTKILEFSRQFQTNSRKKQFLQIWRLQKKIIIYKKKTMSNTSKMTPTVIGIDIGAHSSKISAVQRGAIDIVTNEANFRETPSIVGYGDGQRKIGEAGNVKLRSNFKNTIISPMRYLGLGNEVQGQENFSKQLKYCPCPTEINDGQLFFKVNQDGNPLNLKPEQVLASYLTHIKSIIAHNGLDDKLVSIAIPPYFTQAERKGVLNAAEIARLSNVRLVEQNIAMGLDYGVFKKNQIGQEGKTVIFVDFGHSKLSMSALRFKGEQMQVLTQKHNRNLGCRDIDYLLFEHYAAIFKQKTGLDLSENKKACLKLLQVIQKQRKILSGINETDLSIECLMEDQDISESMSRQTIIKVAENVFANLKNNLAQFKEDLAQLNIPIQQVELVGGGSRIPAVIETINQIFGVNASRTINSSQTIANGATLFSVQKSGLFRLRTFNCVSLSYYPIQASWKTEKENIENQVICQANEILPCQKQIAVSAKDKTQVLLSYDMFDEEVSTKILNILYENNQENPQVKIKLYFNNDGFVQVKQIISAQGKKINFKVENYGQITRDQLQKFKAKQRQMYVKDFQIVRGYEKKNDFQSYIFSQKDKLNSKDLNEYLSQQDKSSLKKYFEHIEEEMDDTQKKLSLKEYENKMKQVQKTMNDAHQIVKIKKTEVVAHIAELEKLKKYAVDNLQYLSSKFRNSRSVSKVYEHIKQVHDWIAGTIEQTKKKPFSQLPIVSNEVLQAKYAQIKQLMQSLLHHHNYEQQQQQQPKMFNPFRPSQSEYRQRNPHPQQRRRQNFDPFMSRSGFFPSNNGFFDSFF